MLYNIVRKYRDTNHPDHNKVILTDLTEEEAKEHCKDPETREAGVWFDCFYEDGDEPDRGYPKVSMHAALKSLYDKRGGK